MTKHRNNLISNGRGMDKENGKCDIYTYIYTHNVILFGSRKKENLIIYNNMDEV